ncbi:FAD synthase [Mycoplasma marinum]|uniref:FAD synthase n=1 Tax=Mycoplasma marinum TaxID=1937190 RepID=A0A4V2NI90_9MOLU|nr:adenylyltransferase/cytidyltransferase family protein [Mycoplasma marinum]TCG11904.1 hypothetical protein C4B24_00715 [Mycoplasma marinum]
MKVFYFPKKVEVQNPVIIMGSFDAIHIGHLELIKAAKRTGKPIILMMFEKPYELPKKTKEMFEQLEVRLQKLSNMEIDYSMLLKNDLHTLSLQPEAFIKEIKEKYNPSLIVCGRDFKFGRAAAGNVQLLEKIFGNVEIVELKKISDVKISTSIIKEQIPFGELEFANSLLVSPWTTNVQIKTKNDFILDKHSIKPHSGFYAATAIENNIMYHCVIHVTRKGEYFIHMLNNKENLQNKFFSLSWWRQLEITIKDENDEIREEHLKAANLFFKNSL